VGEAVLLGGREPLLVVGPEPPPAHLEPEPPEPARLEPTNLAAAAHLAAAAAAAAFFALATFAVAAVVAFGGGGGFLGGDAVALDHHVEARVGGRAHLPSDQDETKTDTVFSI
jgi:hypothetical protein